MTQRFSFNWDAAEYVRVHHAVSKHLPGGWLRLARSFLPLLVLLFVVFLLSIGWGNWTALAVAAAPWLVLLTLWIGLILWGWPYLAARRLQKQDPSTQGPMGREVSAEGIRMTATTGVVELRWVGIVRAVETPEFFLFYYNRQCAHYLPKRAIGTSAELAAVRNLLREHLGPKARVDTPAPGAA